MYQETTGVATDTVAFSDVPDPDNFMMHAYYLLNRRKDSMTAIVLSPRPVSFAVVPLNCKYSDFWQEVWDATGDTIPIKMLYPIRQKKDEYDLSKVNRDYHKWLRLDEDFKDQNVREDTKLYMELSAVRLVSFLDIHGITLDRYRIFSEERSRSAQSTITTSLHHVGHVTDFAWDFNISEQNRYKAMLGRAWQQIQRKKLDTINSPSLRDSLRKLCEDYIERRGKELKLRDPKNIMNKLSDLIHMNLKADLTPFFLLAGPFTEPLQYLEETKGKVKSVFAMAGYIHGGVNLFENQFNMFVDMGSAQKFIDLVMKYKIETTFLPTECVKGSKFAYDDARLHELWKVSPAAKDLIRRYYRPDFKSFPVFDLVTAVVMRNPHLLKTRRVHIYQSTTKVPGKSVFLAEEKHDAHIAMTWNDPDVMEANKDEMFEDILKTFRMARAEHGVAHTPMVRNMIGTAKKISLASHLWRSAGVTSGIVEHIEHPHKPSHHTSAEAVHKAHEEILGEGLPANLGLPAV